MTASMSFTVFVDGADMGRRVRARLDELCAEHGVAPQIVVVDVGSDPAGAEKHNVVGVPTVVREAPAPRRRVIGALEDSRRVADALGLDQHQDADGGPA